MSVRWSVVVSVLLLPAVALAQAPPYEGQPVDIYTGVVTAPAGILAQGGAYIGVAEGAAGMKFNPASVANRFAYFTDEYWDWDWNLDYTILGLADLGEQDLFNSGRFRLDVEQLQTTNAAIDVQIERFGLGISISNIEIRECDGGTADCLALDAEQRGTITRITTLRLGAGYVFRDGDLVIGGNIFAPSIAFIIDGDDSASPGISGGTVELGALWRPAGEDYRLGLTWRPRSRSIVESTQAGRTVATRRVPPSLVSPWIVGIGAAYAFGSRPMNLRPSFGDAELVADDYEDYPRGHFQASADLILIGSESDTVGLDGWFAQEAQPAGRELSVSVHLGVQGEVIENLMVARLGGYLEPSRFAETDPRPHATGGLDFRLFELIWEWRAGFAFDIARDFNQLTLSGGFWY